MEIEVVNIKKKSKRVAIKKKKKTPTLFLYSLYRCILSLLLFVIIKCLIECFGKNKEKCTIIKPPKWIVYYITPITYQYLKSIAPNYS